MPLELLDDDAVDDDVVDEDEDVGPPVDDVVDEDVGPVDDAMPLDVLAGLPPLPVVLEVVGPTPSSTPELVDVLDAAPPVPSRTGSSPVAHATTAGPSASAATSIDFVETSFPRMSNLSRVTSAQ